jgi:nicotinamide-nucleotide amidase
MRPTNRAASDHKLLALAARVGREFSESNATLVTAESCTGGWIAKTLTDVAGSSAWFLEAFVTYSNPSKVMRLGVSATTLKRHGAVSEATARAMARGALLRSGADAAVSVTGIAGPGGAVPGKPVGTVWLCWAKRTGAGVRLTAQRQLFRGDRDQVRRKTVRLALQGLLRH